MSMETNSKELKKPVCPNCGRANVRCRHTKAFEGKPMVCCICGHEWKPEDPADQ